MAGTQNQPLEYEQVSYNAPDGVQMGRASTEKLAFYGTAPIARPVVTGIVSSATFVSTLLTALGTLGLITDSTTP